MNFKCKICNHPHSHVIETWRLGEELTYPEIVRRCQEELDLPISTRTLATHFSQHMDITAVALRENQAEHALLLRSGVAKVKNDLHVLDSIIEKGFEQIRFASLSDAMKAIELKHKITGGKNLYACIDSDEKYQALVAAIKQLPEDSKRMLLENLAQQEKEKEEADRLEAEEQHYEDSRNIVNEFEFS